MVEIFLTKYDGAILGPIAKLLGVVLNWLYEFLNLFGIQNAGLSIILFTFIVNGLMIPLTLKQQKFSKLSAKMSPEMNKITQKYKNKKDEVSMRAQQAEMQALYQKYGTSPTGGCLPMLITLPILFALYRVIYNIPAYVDSVKLIYDNVATAIQGTNGYADIISTYVVGQEGAIKDAVSVITSKWGDMSAALQNPNHIIDILSQFKEVNWQILASDFPSISTTIQSAAAEIGHINSFLGMNIANHPAWNSISVLVPVLSVVTQIVQTKMITPPETSGADENNPTASTMKMMNTVMPFVSGMFCYFMPIGMGIYWVAGSVFRIVQQFFVNKYMDNMNIDSLIEKNVEKANKKRARLGMESLEEAAKHRSTAVPDRSSAVTKSTKKNEPSNYKKGEVTYQPGSISSIANMMKNSNSKNNSGKGDK